MSATLAQIRQRCLVLEPELGRTETIASIASKGITVTRLAVGTIGEDKLRLKWMLRPDAASQPADRLRFSNSYDSNVGTVYHEGAAYADTTATSESVEFHEHEPHLLDLQINETLRNTRFRDRTIVWGNNAGEYWLTDLTWVLDPADILRVGFSAARDMTGNRHLAKWNGYQTVTAGLLAPDIFTLAGTGATFALSTTARRGGRSLAITSTGSNVATVSVVIPLFGSDVANDTLRSQIITGVSVSRSAQASSHRVRVTSEDGSGVVLSTTNASYHAAGGVWAETTAQHTIHASAEQVRLSFRQEVAETGLLNELYMVQGVIDDSARRDIYPVTWWDRVPHFEQGQPLLYHSQPGFRGTSTFSGVSMGRVLIVETQRPYATFTEARVLAGTADLDATDAPLDLIAHGALWRFYEGLGETAKALKHRARHKAMQAQHLASENDGRGWTLPSPDGRVNARVR